MKELTIKIKVCVKLAVVLMMVSFLLMSCAHGPQNRRRPQTSDFIGTEWKCLLCPEPHTLSADQRCPHCGKTHQEYMKEIASLFPTAGTLPIAENPPYGKPFDPKEDIKDVTKFLGGISLIFPIIGTLIFILGGI